MTWPAPKPMIAVDVQTRYRAKVKVVEHLTVSAKVKIEVRRCTDV